jgi:hypothetical protein
MLNTNSLGQSLGYQNGTLVEQIPNGDLVAPIVQSAPTTTLPEVYGMPEDQYVTTLSGYGTGSAKADIFHSNALLTFNSLSMTPATQDTIIFSQDGNTVTLSTNVPNEQYSTTLHSRVGTSVREYTVANTAMESGEKITQALINGGASFEINNQGSAKTYDLTIQQVGTGQGVTSLTGLNIGAGETHVFTVNDWTNLPSTGVNLQVLNSQGTNVATEALQVTFADANRKTQLTVNTLDKLFRFLGSNLDSDQIKAPKMRVINIDPSNPSSALAYNKLTKKWQPDPSKLGVPPLAAACVSQCQFDAVPKELIVIPYEDANILFFAVAVHSTKDRCLAFLYQKSTKKTFLLVE